MRLEELGFVRIGWFNSVAGDAIAGQSIEIIGSAGPLMFDCFQGSAEYRDGKPNPLDRWTKSGIGRIAKAQGLDVVFPFEGPPYHPFQQWAMRADLAFFISPLGILVHETFGLWIGLRAALIHPGPAPAVVKPRPPHPCKSCEDKPCLTACPVDAFKAERETLAPEGYDAAACAGHIAGRDLKNCMTLACAARRACPLGRGYTLSEDQARFHMKAFVAADHSAA